MGFAPGLAAQLARGSASIESPAGEGALWLLVVALSCLAVGCAGPAHQQPAADHLDSARSAAGEDVVIEARDNGGVPMAARRVGERFLSAYVAFLYGRGRADELTGATSELRCELRRARLRVPPARATRNPTIIRLRSAEQPPATVVVTAIVNDGDLAAYPVTAVVQRRTGRWQVTRLADD